MSANQRKELAILRVYGFVATILLTVFSVSGFTQTQKPRFAEIDVERINVIEPDGSYRMVISNKARSIGPMAYGKPFGYSGGTRPGIIFFNDEGTENGASPSAARPRTDGTRRPATSRSISTIKTRFFT